MKRLKSLGVLVGVTGLLWQLALPAFAHQTKRDGDVTITFHVQPDDSPTANQETTVWVRLQRDGRQVPLAQCEGCRLLLLAPDGQILNEFTGSELQPVSVSGYPGAFGTQMIFGAPGDFAVRLQGAVNGNDINSIFSVPVEAP